MKLLTDFNFKIKKYSHVNKIWKINIKKE